MSKSVLISIQPKWCELIASGEKTIEVRKSAPKLETPFKCYIYETKDKKYEKMGIMGYRKDGTPFNFLNRIGKVIGEFVCNKILEYECSSVGHGELATTCGTCLTYDDIINYCNGKTLYGWHISDLVIYEQPKELSEFRKPFSIDDNRPMKDWCHNHCEICDEKNCKYDLRIKRPPQSWFYIEELEK